MLDNFPLSLVLPYLALVTVILTVVVGLLGLRQGYYRNGKLTRRGRRMVIWMVVLGIATLVSAIVDRQISARKDKEASDIQARHFDSQMGTLREMQQSLGASIGRQEGLIRNIRDIQSTLDQSLVRQERLADAAARNLRLSQTLQREAQRNTNRVLQRIVEDTNRFSLRDIVVMVLTDCPDDTSLPQPDTFQLSMLVRGSRGMAVAQQFNLVQRGNVIVFDRMEGPLNNFDTFPAWQDARVSFHITAFAQDFRSQRMDEEGDRWPEGAARRFGARAATVCPVTISVHVKGQTLLRTSGELAERAEGMFSVRVRGVQTQLQQPLDLRRWPFDL